MVGETVVGAEHESGDARRARGCPHSALPRRRWGRWLAAAVHDSRQTEGVSRRRYRAWWRVRLCCWGCGWWCQVGPPPAPTCPLRRRHAPSGADQSVGATSPGKPGEGVIRTNSYRSRFEGGVKMGCGGGATGGQPSSSRRSRRRRRVGRAARSRSRPAASLERITSASDAAGTWTPSTSKVTASRIRSR